ncbi:BMC domain-containing protein [Maledivibacter halophilus]|nr:BMC domain-containing protein [Maledivibacter halophilus]
MELEDIHDFGAVGLLQGKIMDMLYAADIAEKTADVCVEDIRGNCPTTMTTLAIFGSVEAVEIAIQEIRKSGKEDGR